jgi:hypothetical protein
LQRRRRWWRSADVDVHRTCHGGRPAGNRRRGTLQRTCANQRTRTLQRTSAEQRARALKRAGTLQRATTLKRTATGDRPLPLERTATIGRTVLERISASNGTIAARTAATTLPRAPWTSGTALGISLDVLLVTLLHAPRTFLQRVRLSLREGDATIENRDRSDQTLRSKCNFIH